MLFCCIDNNVTSQKGTCPGPEHILIFISETLHPAYSCGETNIILQGNSMRFALLVSWTRESVKPIHYTARQQAGQRNTYLQTY